MFSCFSISSTHVRDANLAKNDLLTKCIQSVSTITSIADVEKYLQFTCECIDGTKGVGDCHSELEKKIYLLTGNENNSIFARQTVTRGATFLLFALCVKYVQLNPNIGTLTIPDDSYNVENKYLFIKDVMNLSCLKDNKSISYACDRINQNYLKWCYYGRNNTIIINDPNSYVGCGYFVIHSFLKNDGDVCELKEIELRRVNCRRLISFPCREGSVRLKLNDSQDDKVTFFELDKPNLFRVTTDDGKNPLEIVDRAYFIISNDSVEVYNWVTQNIINENLEKYSNTLHQIRNAFVGYNDLHPKAQIKLPDGFEITIQKWLELHP